LCWVLLPTKRKAQQKATLGYTPLKRGCHYDYWNQSLNMALARLLPRLSWSLTAFIPSTTHRKTITSITADILPFVTNLLTSWCMHYTCIFLLWYFIKYLINRVNFIEERTSWEAISRSAGQDIPRFV
jgi:hypothetical protein